MFHYLDPAVSLAVRIGQITALSFGTPHVGEPVREPAFVHSSAIVPTPDAKKAAQPMPRGLLKTR
ncbi:hypothetical protein [Caballeronia sp. BR00000012568055]|uniref:hypothetical protein n=1 Tax=Caballeronia sp. BR00000012568055 TaxID=2918761 RepID=UPI0023F8A31A|nr:hypothetical protein [Caballeronia sp. BR00000012568055]